MTAAPSYRICRIWDFPDRPADEPRYEIDKICDLSAVEYERITSIYQRLLRSNHPAMAELLADVIADYKVGHGLLTIGANHGKPSKQRAERATKQGRISAFAAANAVYAYQEHAMGIANRIGGNTPVEVDNVFRQVYEENWPYLFVYKLRKIFTHVSIQALASTVRSTALAEGKSVTSLDTTILRSAVRDLVGPKVRGALDEYGADPTLEHVLAEALAGVMSVQSRIRMLTYPELSADIEYLSRWHRYFLAEPPVCVAEFPPDPRIETMTITAILPSELRTAGMTGP